MGAVYESQSPEDGKPLAIKVLAIDFVTDTDIKNRFIEEGHTTDPSVSVPTAAAAKLAATAAPDPLDEPHAVRSSA